MALQHSPPLILFSGLAADAQVFALQKLAFPQLIVPDWPTPRPTDTLDSYCGRIAEQQPYGPDAILGGASFGGIIALHVAQRRKPRAVILMSSVRSPAELSPLAKFCRPLQPFVQWLPVRFLQWCCAPLELKLVPSWIPHLSGLARQFRRSDPTVFRWSLSRILDWTTAPQLDCPVFQIHGDRDHVLPMRYTNPDSVVVGGGHVISMTHPEDVNDFIRSVIHVVTESGDVSDSPNFAI